MVRPLASSGSAVSDADRVKAQIKAVRAARAAEKAARDESDPRLDPPASTVTAGIMIKGRPTASWAMALVAMGLFGGLLTAVVARGDGDSLVAAGAAFVDPGQAAQITAAHELQPFQPTTIQQAQPAAATQAPSVTDTSDIVPTVVVAPETKVAAVARPAPVAAPRPIAPRIAAPPAADKPVAAVTPAPKPAAAPPAVAAKPAAKPKAPVNDDMATAAAADALAKAQLESSLK
jgi:hypothetical protein